MYESKEEYQAIVLREVVLLEREQHVRIKEGETGLCPRCGLVGTWDLGESKGFSSTYGNSIYYSTVYNHWRCRVCDFRMQF